MLRTAFSTVACPTWTVERVATAAEEWGFLGVEFRSFGQGGTEFACDPALMSGEKFRRVLADAGIEAAGIATGCRFDTPLFPPVLGEIFLDREKTIRAANHMVSVARDCGAGSIRVFAYESPGRERRAATLKRICNRLRAVCDYARNKDVMVLLENGGSFSAASDLMEIIEKVGSPLLGACYDGTTAWQAGEDVAAGCALLGSRLRMVRLRDITAKEGGHACRLGSGAAPCRELVTAAKAADEAWATDPWVVYSWDRAWLPELSPAEQVLPQVAPLIAQWAGVKLGQRRKYEARQSAAPAMMGV
jgi:fatty-acyl-CoA synthase